MLCGQFAFASDCVMCEVMAHAQLGVGITNQLLDALFDLVLNDTAVLLLPCR